MMIKTAAVIAAMLVAVGVLQSTQPLYGENEPGTYESIIISPPADNDTTPVFKYTKQSDMTIRITGYNGGSDVNIPSAIDSLPVTGIGTTAFIGSNIKTAVIPKGVTFIDNSAFKNCKSLKKVTLPNTLKEFGPYAFCDCTSLKSIVIPKSVTYIGNGAFGVTDEKTGKINSSSDIVLQCTEGSYAESYAKANGLKYKLIKKDTDSDTSSKPTGKDSDISSKPTGKDSDTSSKPTGKNSDTDREPVTPEKQKYMIGDADGDKYITSADALTALRISAGLDISNEKKTKVCDIDKDGHVTSADALDILRHSAGLKSSSRIGTLEY